MGSLSFTEILTILVVVLLIFGPNRLPEFARRVGELIAKGRQAVAAFTDQLNGEHSDAMEPLRDLKREFDGAKQDISDAMTTFAGGGTMQSPAEADGTVDETTSASIDAERTPADDQGIADTVTPMYSVRDDGGPGDSPPPEPSRPEGDESSADKDVGSEE